MQIDGFCCWDLPLDFQQILQYVYKWPICGCSLNLMSMSIYVVRNNNNKKKTISIKHKLLLDEKHKWTGCEQLYKLIKEHFIPWIIFVYCKCACCKSRIYQLVWTKTKLLIWRLSNHHTLHNSYFLCVVVEENNTTFLFHLQFLEMKKTNVSVPSIYD